MSKRERVLGIMALAAALLLLAWYQGLRPYLRTRAALTADIAAAGARLEKARAALDNRARVATQWNKLLAAGLRADPSETESLGLHAVTDWAQAARVEVQSRKPERAAPSGDFQTIRLHVGGTANSPGLATFLYNIETASFPSKITDLRVVARREGTDDLAFQLTMATVVFTPQPETRSVTRPAARGGGR